MIRKAILIIVSFLSFINIYGQTELKLNSTSKGQLPKTPLNSIEWSPKFINSQDELNRLRLNANAPNNPAQLISSFSPEALAKWNQLTNKNAASFDPSNRHSFDPGKIKSLNLYTLRANDEIALLKEKDPEIKIALSEENGTPFFIYGNNLFPVDIKGAGKDREKEIVALFMKQYPKIFKIKNPDQEWGISKIETDYLGGTHVRMQQYFQGLAIYGSDIVVHFGEYGIKGMSGRYYPTPVMDNIVPTIDTGTVYNIVESDLGLASKSHIDLPIDISTVHPDFHTKKASLQLFIHPENNKCYLAWVIAYNADIHHSWSYIVDARTGDILKKSNAICHNGPATATAFDLYGANRTIHTYEWGNKFYFIDASRPMFSSTAGFPHDPVEGVIWTMDYQSGNPNNPNGASSIAQITSPNNLWNNPKAVSAHYHAGIVYEYFHDTFNRNSIDGMGGRVLSYINVNDPIQSGGGPMDNAFWNPALNAMFYGNGTGSVFIYPFQKALDVCAHELTHGITQETANLRYEFQSGALNESFSDIFGAMVDREDWQLAEDIVNPLLFTSGAMRNLMDPHNGGNAGDIGWQPAHMSEYVNLPITQDQGGVHINSGIPNKAFYYFANTVGKEKAEQVYYRALTVYLTQYSQFIDCRFAVIQSAEDLYGPTEIAAAQMAFDNVGILGIEGPNYLPGDLPEVEGPTHILTQTFYQNQPVLADYSLDDLTYYVRAFANAIPKASVSEDGTLAAFVGADENIYLIDLTDDNPATALIQVTNDHAWRKIALNRDGSKVALLTDNYTPYVYILDIAGGTLQEFEIYNPGTGQDLNAGIPAFVDAIEFDPTGEFLAFDMYNIASQNGTLDYGAWSIGLLHVWRNATDNYGSGTVYQLLSPQTTGINIGNPTFAKNASHIIAFDYFDDNQQFAYIVAANIFTGQANVVFNNFYYYDPPTGTRLLGYPTYSPPDNALAFTSVDADLYFLIVAVDMATDKITTAGNPGYVVYGNSPVWYAVGERNFIVPGANFTANITSGPAPLTVNFFDLSVNDPLEWKWTLSSGVPSISYEKNPVVTYNNPGVYTVSLRVANDAGSNTKTKVGYITVTEPIQAPVANFIGQPTSGFAPLTVTFQDISENEPTSWLWVFGDGNFSTQQNPIHTYTIPGVYEVSLITNNSAGEDIETKIDYIFVNAPASVPIANFIATPVSGVAPLAVSFQDLSANSPTTWLWNFGDGNTSSLQNPMHTYALPGTYTVTLNASNIAGGDIEIKNNLITVSQAVIAPVANFSATPVSGVAPLVVSFQDLSANSPTTWLWNFGDGNTSSLQNPMHTYALPGTYTVTLNVSNIAGGDAEVKSNFITVNQTAIAPVANFSATPVSGVAPLVVSFQDLSANSPTTWFWNFGDGNTSSLQNPMHTYALPGTYTVTLNASNIAGGDVEVKSNFIIVNQTAIAPVANFSATPVSGVAPLVVSFQDLSANSPTTWLWDFGDGNTSGVQNPQHTYTLPGAYTVSLTTSNIAGSDVETKVSLIVVNSSGTAPSANFGASSVCGEAPLNIQFSDFSSNNPVSWNWQFPGGTPSSSNLPNPAVVYQSPGIYEVSLSVNNAFGNDTETKVGYITVVNPISVIVTPSNSICQGESIILQASGSANYVWSGTNLNGTTGSLVTASPQQPGTYSYVVIGSVNNCNTSPEVVEVTVNPRPVISISAETTNGCTGQPLELTASGAIEYNWVGPGLSSTTGESVMATAVVPITATYQVIGQSQGCASLPQSINITFNASPQISLVASDTSICLGESVSFTAFGANQYTWTGQGLNNLSGNQVTATPGGIGLSIYTVQGNSNGCNSNAQSITVDVNSVPNIIAFANPQSICLGESVNLAATGASQYIWSGPGLSSTTGQQVSAIPTIAGNVQYTVVGNIEECSSAPFLVNITVESTIPAASISFTGCPGNTIEFAANLINAGTNPTIIWYLNGNQVWVGNTYTLFDAGLGDQVYCSVIVGNDVVCPLNDVVQSNVVTVDCIAVGIKEEDVLNNYINVYPNPNYGSFALKWTTNEVSTLDIRILNALGEELVFYKKLTLSANEAQEIAIPNAQSGLYYLQISVGDKQFFRKIMVVNP